MVRTTTLLVVCGCLASAVVAPMQAFAQPAQKTKPKANGNSAPQTPAVVSAEKPVEVVFPGPQAGGEVCLAFVGDLMHHCVQGSGADIYPGGPAEGYAAYFRWVKPVLDSAHVAIGNLETPIDKAPRDCFPRFRAPPEYPVGIRKGGFDVVGLANNHMMDYGPSGLDATLKWVSSAGLAAAGSTLQMPYLMLKVGDVKVGLVVYTMLSNGPCRTAPCPLRTEKRNVVDAGLEAAVRRARLECDVVVVYVHWMEENQSRSREVDRKMARQLVGIGADAVIGHHPHVVASASYVWVTRTANPDLAKADGLVDALSKTPSVGQQRAYVRYSLGNFVSGMKAFPYRMGGIDTVCFGKSGSSPYQVSRVSFIPTYVRRDTWKVRSRTYEVLPLETAAQQCREGKGPYPALSGSECKEIQEYEKYLNSRPDFRP